MENSWRVGARRIYGQIVVPMVTLSRMGLRLAMSRTYRERCKGKAVPLQAWSDPEGYRKFSFPDYMTTVQDGDNVASLTHRPPLPPGNVPGTHFC